MNISLVQLEYVLALQSQGSFVAAAAHCHVTQPTLSMQLKKLEEELGVLIFDRSKQPLMPTYLGSRIIEQAREALSQVEKIGEIINESKGVVKGELNIGIIPTLSPYLLPLFVGEFLRKYPGVQLSIQDLKTEEILSRIKKDQLDVGILVTPTQDAAVTESPVFYEEFYVYVDAGLAAQVQENYIEIDQLLDNKLWLLEEGNCFRNQTFNLCNIDQVKYKDIHFRYESGNLQTLMKMVDFEGGATLIPQLAADDLSEERKERLRFISRSHPVREVSTVYSRKFGKLDLIRRLQEEIRASLPSEILNNAAENVVGIY